MDKMKKADAGTSASKHTTSVNSYPNSTAAVPGEQPLFTVDDFLAWRAANAEPLEAKRAAAEAVRQAERAAELQILTDLVIRKVAGFLEQGHEFQDICQSMLGNAYRDGAPHEALNVLAQILASMGWEGSSC